MQARRDAFILSMKRMHPAPESCYISGHLVDLDDALVQRSGIGIGVGKRRRRESPGRNIVCRHCRRLLSRKPMRCAQRYERQENPPQAWAQRS